MQRRMRAALLGALAMTAFGGSAANAADLDYEYAAPPPRLYAPPPAYAPPVAYAPRIVEEPRIAVDPQRYVYPRPYLYPGPYGYARHMAPPFYGPYRRFAYGPRYRGGYGPGWSR